MMRGITATLLCIGLVGLLFLPAVDAAETGWSAEERLSSPRPSVASEIEIEVSVAGQAIAAWECRDASSLVTSSWVAMYEPGRGWSDGTPLDGTSYSSYVGDVDINDNGTAVAVWTRIVNGFDYPVASIYLAGVGWQDPQMLSTVPADAIYSMAVAMDDKGEAAVAWDSSVGVAHNIMGSFYSPASGWSSVGPLMLSTNMLLDPLVGINDNGDSLVVWKEQIQTPGQSDIGVLWYSKYTATSGWTAPAEVNGDDVGLGTPCAHMAMNGNGEAILAYSCAVAGSKTAETHAAYYDGEAWLPPVALSEEDDSESACPDVGLNDAGWGMVVWAEWNGGIKEYRYRVFEAGDFGAIGVIPHPSMDKMNWPYIDVSEGGNVIVTTKATLDGGGTEHAYAVIYSPAAGWSQWERLDKNSLYPIYFLVHGGIDLNGGAVVAWISYDDASNQNSSIRATSYTPAVQVADLQGEVNDLRGQLAWALVVAAVAAGVAIAALVLLIRGRRG